MIFDVITIFPEIFEGFTQEGILAKAIEKNLLRINIHDLRNWVDDKHKKVDDKPFGGGLGMVMKVEPI
ncbi:MAG: tRNA (guanosine(37)-N1)-methyltransferase TrmD, partial [Minisyncoccales bacterium]